MQDVGGRRMEECGPSGVTPPASGHLTVAVSIPPR